MSIYSWLLCLVGLTVAFSNFKVYKMPTLEKQAWKFESFLFCLNPESFYFVP